MSDSTSSGGSRVPPVIGTDKALEQYQNEMQRARRLRLGFPWVESTVKVSSGRYYVLAARPGLYKTTLAWTWAWNLALGGNPVLWVGLEMPPSQMMALALARFSGIHRDALDAHFGGTTKLFDSQIVNLQTQAIAAAQVHDLVFHQSEGTLAAVLDSMSKAPYAAVFVDYIQLVQGIGQSETERIGSVSKALAWHAHQRNVAVFALSQLNRAIDNVEGTGVKVRCPRLSDLKGSGQIEQDADAVMFLHDPGIDPERDRTHPQLIVEKNRYGKGGIVKLQAKPEIGFIEEEA